VTIKFYGYTVPPDMWSDGCSWSRDSWFGVSIKPACQWHDLIRRYGLERRIVADFLAARIMAKLLPLWHPMFPAIWVPVVYYIGMSAISFIEWIGEASGNYIYQSFPDAWQQYLPDGHRMKK